MEKLTGTKRVHRFGYSGWVGDESLIPSTRLTWEKHLDDEMRENGYIPILDLGSQLFTSYDAPQNRFDVTVVIQGIYVGKRKAWELLGVEGTTLIPASSQSTKPKRS
jgi:hypothetical protein